jgi:hypothetical protein
MLVLSTTSQLVKKQGVKVYSSSYKNCPCVSARQPGSFTVDLDARASCGELQLCVIVVDLAPYLASESLKHPRRFMLLSTWKLQSSGASHGT